MSWLGIITLIIVAFFAIQYNNGKRSTQKISLNQWYSYDQNGLYFEEDTIFSWDVRESEIYHSGIILHHSKNIFVLWKPVDDLQSLDEFNNLYNNMLFSDNWWNIYFLRHKIPGFWVDRLNSKQLESNERFIWLLDAIEPFFIDKNGFLFSLSGRIKEYTRKDISAIDQENCLLIEFNDWTIFAHKFIYKNSIESFFSLNEATFDNACNQLLKNL